MTRPERQPLFSRRERVVAWTVGLLMGLGLLLLVLWQLVFVPIAPGEVGVRYRLLGGGTVTDEVLPEGFAVKLPWDRIYLYEVRTQRYAFSTFALSLEGMYIRLEGTLLYRPVYDRVGLLHKKIGPDYRDRVVGPAALSAVRQIIGRYNSHELYTVDYDTLRSQVLGLMRLNSPDGLVEFQDLLVATVEVPRKVTEAIEEKLAQEQLAASYRFRILSQKQEAERLQIEAIGVRTFYSIVSEALNDTLLTWRGIEATVEIAQSPNTKIVIVGGDKNQMPLILGSDVGSLPAVPEPVPSVDPRTSRLPIWSDLPKLFPDIDVDGPVDAGASEVETQDVPATDVPGRPPS